MTAGEKIKKLRAKLKMTQMQFANALGMSVSGVANCEIGIRKPSINTVYKMIKLAQKHGIKIGIEDIFSE